jgi:hypothetical protein
VPAPEGEESGLEFGNESTGHKSQEEGTSGIKSENTTDKPALAAAEGSRFVQISKIVFVVVMLCLGVSAVRWFVVGDGGSTGSDIIARTNIARTNDDDQPWADSSTKENYNAIAELLEERVLAEDSRNKYKLEQATQALESFMASLKGERFKVVGEVNKVEAGYVSVFCKSLEASSGESEFSIECHVYPAGPSLNNPEDTEEVVSWAKAYQVKRYGSVEACKKAKGGDYNYKPTYAPFNFFMIGEEVPEDTALQLVKGNPVILEGTLSHWGFSDGLWYRNVLIYENKFTLHVCNCTIAVK